MNSGIFKGKLAELKVELRAAEKGLILSRPTTDARYDYILDDGQKLSRVQVKYGNGLDKRTPNSVVVDLRKWGLGGTSRDRTKLYKETEVDLLLVYLPKIDKVLKFETYDFCNKTALIIHIGQTKSGQMQKIKFADDYIW